MKYVDRRLLTMPSVALMQVKREIDYMVSLVEENTRRSFASLESDSDEYGEAIRENEAIIDFTNSALTKFLIELSSGVEQSDERLIGSYFHVLNDLERIGDHAENFYEIGEEMRQKQIVFSENARKDIREMCDTVLRMFDIAEDAFENRNRAHLAELTALENRVDAMKKELTANHFNRLAEGNCRLEVSPYYSSTIVGLERVADHLVNVGYSIKNPTGSQKEAN
jgi:phosphate:Na+ symporter